MRAEKASTSARRLSDEHRLRHERRRRESTEVAGVVEAPHHPSGAIDDQVTDRAIVGTVERGSASGCVAENRGNHATVHHRYHPTTGVSIDNPIDGADTTVGELLGGFCPRDMAPFVFGHRGHETRVAFGSHPTELTTFPIAKKDLAEVWFNLSV
jgi:hypothetical protein